MRTIFVSPDFPLNRRMRKAVRRGKLQVVREGEKRLSLGGGMPVESRRAFRTHSSPLVCMADNDAESGGSGGGREWVDSFCGELSRLADADKVDAVIRLVEKSIGGDAKVDLARALAESAGGISAIVPGAGSNENGDIPFTVDRKTTLELFEGNMRYWVPAYQRDYLWGEEEWGDFWGDVVQNDGAQYVGNIVLRTNPETNRLEIIDGQQRLTTVALFVIAAIRCLGDRNILEKEESPVAELSDVFLAQGGIAADDVRGRMKVYPYRPGDAACLATLMEAHPPFPPMGGGHFPPPDNVGEKSQIQMKKAVRFFIEKIVDKWGFPIDGENREAVRCFVFDQMGKNLIFSQVVVGHEVRPHPVFAALNARGKPLESHELIKNHLLSLCGNKRQEEQFEEQWSKITLAIGKEGKLNTGQKELPDHIRAVFMCLHGHVQAKLLFRELAKKVTDEGKANGFLNEMEQHAGLYRGMVEPPAYEEWPGGNRDEDRADMMKRLNMKTHRPLLLATREKFSDEEFSEVLGFVYAISIRNKICGGARPRADGVSDRIFGGLANKVYAGELPAPESVAKPQLCPLYWTKDEFIDTLEKYLVPGANPENLAAKDKYFLRHFFKVLESHLGNNRFEPEDVFHYVVAAPQMRLGNWYVLESQEGRIEQSRYETTKRTVGMSRDERQKQLAKWAAEVPGWRIDCLKGE